MAIHDPNKLWPKLDELGVDEVRKRLAMGVFARSKRPLIEEWLRMQESGIQIEDPPIADDADKMVTCPVCEVRLLAPIEQLNDSVIIRCQNCGPFKLTGTAGAMLSRFRLEKTTNGPLLAHRIRKMNLDSDSLPTIGSDLLLDVGANDRVPTAMEQRANLLRWLGANLTPGQKINLSYESFQAVVGAPDRESFGWLVKSLHERGMLDGVPVQALNEPFSLVDATLSFEGWDEYTSLSTRPTKSDSRSMEVDYDVFISHASEDKNEFVRPLAKALQDAGLVVWYDEFTLTIGDSLRREIDRGLARSRYGIVVISENFLKKEWPQRELDGLVAKEISGQKVILPIWHGVNHATVTAYSPTLADRVAGSSSKGIDILVEELLRVLR